MSEESNIKKIGMIILNKRKELELAKRKALSHFAESGEATDDAKKLHKEYTIFLETRITNFIRAAEIMHTGLVDLKAKDVLEQAEKAAVGQF